MPVGSVVATAVRVHVATCSPKVVVAMRNPLNPSCSFNMSTGVRRVRQASCHESQQSFLETF